MEAQGGFLSGSGLSLHVAAPPGNFCIFIFLCALLTPRRTEDFLVFLLIGVLLSLAPNVVCPSRRHK